MLCFAVRYKDDLRGQLRFILGLAHGCW